MDAVTFFKKFWQQGRPDVTGSADHQNITPGPFPVLRTVLAFRANHPFPQRGPGSGGQREPQIDCKCHQQRGPRHLGQADEVPQKVGEKSKNQIAQRHSLSNDQRFVPAVIIATVRVEAQQAEHHQRDHRQQGCIVGIDGDIGLKFSH